MINVLIVLSGYLFNQLGLSIIVLTLIVNILMYPLTKRQIHASTAMQAIQPKLAELQKKLQQLRHCLEPQVPVWVSWPKKASGVPSDITEDTVRQAALPLGYVDIKVCAVNEVWSGLKLVVRKELR